MTIDINMDTYVIAVKRAMRAEHSVQEAIDVISHEPEVKQLNSGDTGMLLVSVPSQTLLTGLKQKLGEWCHIEPRIDHSTQILDSPEGSFSTFSPDPS